MQHKLHEPSAITDQAETSETLIFLMHCIKVFLSPASNHTLSDRQLVQINWNQLEHIVHKHRLLFVVQQPRISKMLPAQVSEALEKKHKKMVQRNLFLSANTIKVLNIFYDNGIKALPLKGSLLGLQVYDSLASRTPGDIDLLIEPGQGDRALSILKDLGYHWPLAEKWSLTQQRLYLAQQGEVSCFSTKTGISVDLHFRWSGNAQVFMLPFEQAWESATLLQVGSAHRPRVLCLEHQMLYLSVHGAKHKWERLSWLLDIAMLLQQPVNWEIVVEAAKRLKIQRPVGQAIALAHELFNSDIPKAWVDSEKDLNYRDRTSITWLTTVAKKTLQDQSSKSTARHLSRPPVAPIAMVNQLRYRMKLRPSILYKLTCLQRLLISAKDWQILALPESLWFLYVLLRPILYVWRAIYSQKSSAIARPAHLVAHPPHSSR